MTARTVSILAILILLLLMGCSKSGEVTSPGTESSAIHSAGSLPIGISERNPDGSQSGGMGMLGLFKLTIDLRDTSAELVSIRTASATDVLEVVDITNFMRMAPCTSCVKIKSVRLDSDGHPVLSIGIKHPFEAGDPYKPIWGRNRADLHVFNVEGIVVSNADASFFPLLNSGIAGIQLINADGYTGYLDGVLDSIYPTNATIHPYILHFDDYSKGNFDASNPMGFESVTNPPPSGNLVMAMGSDYDYKDYIFDLKAPDTMDFIFAIGCTYGVSSAKRAERFNPQYRVPQFNKKAASEVSVKVISNSMKKGIATSAAVIEVNVVDVNHGVSVGTGLDQMFADSSVKSLKIEIPGIMTDVLTRDGLTPDSGTGHDASDPLIYTCIITNSASADSGDYIGLVKVIDNYTPGQNISSRLEGKDGIKRVEPGINSTTGVFDIGEFATYQVFSIKVYEEIEVVDYSIKAGLSPSLTFMSDGNPAISYHRGLNNYSLMYAYKHDETWHLEMVEALPENSDVFDGTSLAFNSLGNPSISYLHHINPMEFNGKLWFAARSGSTWSIEQIPDSGAVGQLSSLCYNQSGFPVISYHEYISSSGKVKFARNNGTNWQIETPDPNPGEVGGGFTSLALDSNDFPHISYSAGAGDPGQGELRHAWFNGSTWQTEIVDTGIGSRYPQSNIWTTLRINSGDNIYIAYHDTIQKDLKFAWKTGPSWAREVVEGTGDVGMWCSLALNSSSTPYISYHDLTNKQVKIAKRISPSNWTFQTVESGLGSADSYRDTYTSIALDPSETPAVAYFDAGMGVLKYKLCKNL